VTSEPSRTWASAEAVELWRSGAARRAQALAVATAQMLDAAGCASGMRVLDVAAGTGEQSLLAAQRVGPSGAILATDISANMLEAASQAAAEAGFTNLTTSVADASSLDLAEATFDAAICRFGLMFVPDLQQALLGVYRSLKPGAWFAALVWSTEANNPYLGLQLGLIREMDRMPSPPPSLARTVSLSAPGVLEQAFQAAGFRGVRVSAVATPREFPSVAEALAAIRSSSPAGSDLGRDMTEAEREYYTTELGRRLQAYVQPDGRCRLPGEALLGAGAK
jgi:ubiquinone/menaquinone biosynthesis C-methylase UbiE